MAILNKRIAILGATSHIAKDLVQSISSNNMYEVVLYSRRPEIVSQWIINIGLADRFESADFSEFSTDEHFDAILNFVGVGDPAKAVEMGASIFDVTLKYDGMALDYLRQNHDCRYIFMSSGSAYGTSFNVPVDENTNAMVSINSLQPQDWYSVAKLHAECRHRSLLALSIVDIRIFNYFSHTQELDARFFLSDILSAILDRRILKTSVDQMVRDFIGPADFSQLVKAILTSNATNTVVDCYSKAPIDKLSLLSAMRENFGLQYELIDNSNLINATGNKLNYYSLNKSAASFNYNPTYSSLENIVRESNILLSNSKYKQSSK